MGKGVSISEGIQRSCRAFGINWYGLKKIVSESLNLFDRFGHYFRSLDRNNISYERLRCIRGIQNNFPIIGSVIEIVDELGNKERGNTGTDIGDIGTPRAIYNVDDNLFLHKSFGKSENNIMVLSLSVKI